MKKIKNKIKKFIPKKTIGKVVNKCPKFVKRLYDRRGETMVGTVISIIVFAIFLVMMVTLFVFYTQYIYLNNYTENIMSCASTYATTQEVKEKAISLAEKNGYNKNINFVFQDTNTTLPSVNTSNEKDITVVMISDNFKNAEGKTVVQYGDDIDIVVMKKNNIKVGNYYTNLNTVKIKKSGVSRRYFKLN